MVTFFCFTSLIKSQLLVSLSTTTLIYPRLNNARVHLHLLCNYSNLIECIPHDTKTISLTKTRAKSFPSYLKYDFVSYKQPHT